MRPSDNVLKLAREAIDLALKCIAGDEPLLPFIVTEGSPGAVISLVADSSDEMLGMAQAKLDEFGPETKAFAFAYDGFIGAAHERSDCIYVEAAEVGREKVFVFAQRYSPAKHFRAAEPIGNWVCLKQNTPRINWRAEPGAAPNGGPAASVDNSKAPGGPPSVS